MCGVGPADKTGKSVVRYWPGGSFTTSALRRPEKPREMILIRLSPYREGVLSCALLLIVESLERETSALHLRLTQFRALYALESDHGNKPKFTRRVTKICHIWEPFTPKRVHYPTNIADILLLAISLVGENYKKLSTH